MIKKILDNKDAIINYISEDYYKCLYLYLDLKKYELSSSKIKCWKEINENDEIELIALKYYTGMHVFSNRKKPNLMNLIGLIKLEKPTMICGEYELIEKIYSALNDSNYKIEKGWVRGLNNNKYLQNSSDVLKAQNEDFMQIAKLLYDDEDIGSSYRIEDLCNQIIERNKEGYSRNYVIKHENIICSHASTGAEDENVAMLAYVITAPEYRGKGYAKKVCSTICNDLINEGKKIYLINYSNDSTKLYDKLGFKVMCNWGKIYLELKKNGGN